MSPDEKLDALFAAYRTEFPDPEPGAGFMPGLWEKIESRRVESTRMFRRLAHLFVAATLVLIAISTASMPSTDDREAFYSATYTDVLAADFAADYSRVMPVEELQ